jgi:hypothetical protein
MTKKPGSTIPATEVKVTSLAKKDPRGFGHKLPSNLLDFTDGFEEQMDAIILRVTEELFGCAGFDYKTFIYKLNIRLWITKSSMRVIYKTDR